MAVLPFVEKNFMQYPRMGGLLGTDAGDQGTVFFFLCGYGQLGAFVVGVSSVRQGVFSFPRWTVRGFDECGDGDFAGFDHTVGGPAD